MSWYSKVVWSEGLFLRPQHFQQQDRHTEWLVETRARSLGDAFWGFMQLELDQAALLCGKVALNAGRGILPDGTPFDFPSAHAAPPPLDFPADARNAVVYLTLPLRRPHASEVSRDDADGGALTRHLCRDEEVIDSTASGERAEPIEVGQPRLRLLLAEQASDAYVRIGVVRVLERRPDHGLLVDRDYLPPVTACAAAPALGAWLRELQGLLGQRAQALAARLGQPGAGGVAEIGDFLFLLTLNRHRPVLDHLATCSPLHPERLYTRLLELWGELATLTADTRLPGALPAYHHDALQSCFDPLLRMLRLGLATVLEPHAVSIELQDHGQGRYVGLLHERALLRQAGFVLCVNAQIPSEALRARFPAQAKLGPVEQMREIVNLQLPGIALRPLPVAPRQLPYHAGHSYFELDQSGELWQRLEHSGGLGLYVTGDFPGLSLSLWAIKS